MPEKKKGIRKKGILTRILNVLVKVFCEDIKTEKEAGKNAPAKKSAKVRKSTKKTQSKAVFPEPWSKVTKYKRVKKDNPFEPGAGDF